MAFSFVAKDNRNSNFNPITIASNINGAKVLVLSMEYDSSGTIRLGNAPTFGNIEMSGGYKSTSGDRGIEHWYMNVDLPQGNQTLSIPNEGTGSYNPKAIRATLAWFNSSDAQYVYPIAQVDGTGFDTVINENRVGYQTNISRNQGDLLIDTMASDNTSLNGSNALETILIIANGQLMGRSVERWWLDYPQSDPNTIKLAKESAKLFAQKYLSQSRNPTGNNRLVIMSCGKKNPYWGNVITGLNQGSSGSEVIIHIPLYSAGSQIISVIEDAIDEILDEELDVFGNSQLAEPYIAGAFDIARDHLQTFATFDCNTKRSVILVGDNSTSTVSTPPPQGIYPKPHDPVSAAESIYTLIDGETQYCQEVYSLLCGDGVNSLNLYNYYINYSNAGYYTQIMWELPPSIFNEWPAGTEQTDLAILDVDLLNKISNGVSTGIELYDYNLSGHRIASQYTIEADDDVGLSYYICCCPCGSNAIWHGILFKETYQAPILPTIELVLPLHWHDFGANNTPSFTFRGHDTNPGTQLLTYRIQIDKTDTFTGVYLLDKWSRISNPDPGFENLDDPSDTLDPYTESDLIQYTVQAGEELINGGLTDPWYWRVQTYNGTNWSDWSDAQNGSRAFTVGVDNDPPTITLLTTDGQDFLFDTTPTLQFRGNDVDSPTLTYWIQISRFTSFSSRDTISQKSSIDPTGFVDITGGSSDPYTQGNIMEYTIQPGDARIVGTHYWRVFVDDGINDWVESIPYRSFVIQGNTDPTIVLNTDYNENFENDTTPTLRFTGSDEDGDTLTYRIQICEEAHFHFPVIDSYSQPENGDFVEDHGGSPIYIDPFPSGQKIAFTVQPLDALDPLDSGVWYWRVYVSDGGAWFVSEVRAFYINRKPTIALDTDDGHNFGYNYNPSLEFTGSDVDTSPYHSLFLLTYRIVIDQTHHFLSPIIDHYSTNNNLDFVRTDKPIDLDPFAPGYLIKYTVPSFGIPADLYHWKVYVSDDGGSTWVSSIVRTFEISANTSPTIIPITEDGHNFGIDNTPTLEFRGDDVDLEDLTYEIQIDDNELFDNGSGNLLYYKSKTDGFEALPSPPTYSPGFLNVGNNFDTDPFDQGATISYTVQAGDVLADGKWWWKARTSDGVVWTGFTKKRNFIIGLNVAPTIVLETVDGYDFGIDTTPDLDFTGSDVDLDQLSYDIIISANEDLSNAIITASSSVDDTDFTDITTFDTTDPWIQGHTIRYTVASGDALYPGVYYWVVRAYDGALWSTDVKPRMFIIGSGTKWDSYLTYDISYLNGRPQVFNKINGVTISSPPPGFQDGDREG